MASNLLLRIDLQNKPDQPEEMEITKSVEDRVHNLFLGKRGLRTRDDRTFEGPRVTLPPEDGGMLLLCYGRTDGRMDRDCGLRRVVSPASLGCRFEQILRGITA